MTKGELPTALPADSTPLTYDATNIRAYLISPDATTIVPDVTVTTAAIAAAAVTASLSGATNVTLPSGTVLIFGTTSITLAELAELTAVPTAFDIVAAPAAVANASTATYSVLLEIPLAEELTPSFTDQEETIRVHGRSTPIRNVNGKDMTASIRTLAGLDNPVVSRLYRKGISGTPNNRERVLWRYPDGLAILATVNIGAPSPQGQTGNSMRHQFSANLSGKAFYCNLNDANPVWTELGT
ncbi:hypothetical protein [Deinococcus sp. QL22]|uniref:hypothetical protein n=1 Tax=Deinococcus sp. QL22 TaxID=2939437 RepID=UPI00201783A1|nr:hypothetical protein [Deinococcus sp. QL22]UQN06764.1 hypothetical protein M1R55_02245 [Deinococcus sp. QL22]